MNSFLQAHQLPNRETIVSHFTYFSSNSATMTLSDGRIATLRIGDIVDLKDDHKYRVLKIFAPSGPIVFKRIDGSTHRSFLRTPDHVVIKAPPMINRSTQTDLSLLATDDPLADAILQYCGPAAVAAYHQAASIVWAMFIGSPCLKQSKAVLSSLWDTNSEEEGIKTMP